MVLLFHTNETLESSGQAAIEKDSQPRLAVNFYLTGNGSLSTTLNMDDPQKFTY